MWYLTACLPVSPAEAAAAPTAAPGPAQPGHVSPTPATTSPGEKGEAGTPVAAGTSAAAIPRRHAPLEQLVRQGSFRGFPALSQKNSPFKRQLSLRLNELPSTLQRRTDFQVKGTGEPGTPWEGTSGSVPSLVSTRDRRRGISLDRLALSAMGKRGGTHHGQLAASATNKGGEREIDEQCLLLARKSGRMAQATIN